MSSLTSTARLFKFLFWIKLIFKKKKIILQMNKVAQHLDSWVFDKFVSSDELFAKALGSLETSISINNNLYEKLVS